MTPSIILGTASPRRKEIIEFFSLPYVQMASHFDEEAILFEGDPEKYALTLARGKAAILAKLYSKEIILTADTVVFCEKRLYNKPGSEKEAMEFLSKLAGKWQSVYTAVVVQRGEEIYEGVQETRLRFHPMSESQIRKFHSHCYYLDKAGGYAIEKTGSLIVDRIEGCYYNVLGLPIATVARLLLKVGIDLWDYLRDF